MPEGLLVDTVALRHNNVTDNDERPIQKEFCNDRRSDGPTGNVSDG